MKQKVLNKRLKAVAAMAEAKKRQKKCVVKLTHFSTHFRLNKCVVASLFLV